MTENTFLRWKDIANRWSCGKTFIYDEVKRGHLAPSDRGRWPLSEIKRYERAAYVSTRKKAA